MQIFQVLQIFCLVHDVNHGFYIILSKPVSRGAYIWKKPTHGALDVFADPILDGWGPRQGTDSPVDFRYNTQSRLRQVTSADDACSSYRWLRSCQRRGRFSLMILI